MKARLTLQPGQDGTRKLVEKYGDRLLYVRYRYDADRKRRVKTVELIEEEVPWLPSHGRLSRKSNVPIRVTVREIALQRRVRQAGGKWDAHQKVWHLPYEDVVELGLEERIVVLDSADGHE
ncbi:MAG: hypothetical protein JW912_06775 [Sedimentisphaerales bacterium]|nr:hypothetical protein [Sedimentisphaerales bacterium]